MEKKEIQEKVKEQLHYKKHILLTKNEIQLLGPMYLMNEF